MGLVAGKPSPPPPAPLWVVPSPHDGVPTVVLDLGGSGPPLIMLHATGLNAWAYGPLARALGARFRCLALDVRGHGASGCPADTEGGFRWDVLVGDVIAAVGAAGARGGLAMGHSLGGALAVAAEQRSPGIFAAIYCFEPSIVPPPPDMRRFLEERTAYAAEGRALSERARARRFHFPSKAAALRAFGDRPPLDALDPECLANYVEAGLRAPRGGGGGVELACPPEVEARCYEAAGEGGGVFLGLRRMGCPVAVARSSLGGGPMPSAFAGVVAAELGVQGTALEVAGVGHFGPLESPVLVAESVANFFEGVGTAARSRL